MNREKDRVQWWIKACAFSLLVLFFLQSAVAGAASLHHTRFLGYEGSPSCTTALSLQSLLQKQVRNEDTVTFEEAVAVVTALLDRGETTAFDVILTFDTQSRTGFIKSGMQVGEEDVFVKPHILPVSREETPGWQLLEIFGLQDPGNLPEGVSIAEEFELRDNARAVRINLPERSDPEKPPMGLEIFQDELLPRATGIGPLRQIDLIYDESGHLIFVYPVIEAEWASWLLALEGEGYNQPTFYCDFAWYWGNMEALQPGSPFFTWRWMSFTQERAAADAIIKDYEKKLPKKVKWLSTKPLGGEVSFVYVEIDSSGAWDAQNIMFSGSPKKTFPEQLEELEQRARKKGTTAKVFTVFPMVYSPGDKIHKMADHLFFETILSETPTVKEDDMAIIVGRETQKAEQQFLEALLSEKLTIREGNSTFVVGTGSGADAWVAWRKTKTRPFINDLSHVAVGCAVANSKIAGFDVETAVGDIGGLETGELVLPEAFPEEGVDVVIWDAPVFEDMPYQERAKLRLVDHHDDVDFSVFERFLRVLNTRLLREGGHAFIWQILNSPTDIENFERRIRDASFVAIREKDPDRTNVYTYRLIRKSDYDTWLLQRTIPVETAARPFEELLLQAL